MSPIPEAERIIVLLLLLSLVPAVTANDYLVTSGYDHPFYGEASEPVPVGFWHLPLWIILLEVACMPLEILLNLKILAGIGYHRLGRDKSLENESRLSIFRYIRENPGVHLRGIATDMGVSLGTLRYHIQVLGDTHRISVVEEGGHKRFFENGGTYSEVQQTLLRHLRNETTHDILTFLMTHPSASRQEIAGAVGISGSTVTWHMQRLAGDEIVENRKDGRYVRYTIACEYADELRIGLRTVTGVPASARAS